MRARIERVLVFSAAAALIAAVLYATVVAIRGDNLANAADDAVPLFLLAAVAALGAGWARTWEERRRLAEEDANERAELRETLEAARERLQAELAERTAELQREREEHAEQLEREREEREAELAQAREEHAAELQRVRDEKEAELAQAREQHQEALAERDRALDQAKEREARLEHRHDVEREWIRELRTQVAQLHRERGALGDTDDIRELVLRVALKLVGADKGLLLSREDADSDGNLDLVCALGFRHDPSDSAVAQRFANEVLDRDETVREDDISNLPEAHRTEADEEIENLVAIPIYIQDDFQGIVVCANKDGGFHEYDDDVLLALGDQAGAVLHNQRLRGELRSAYVATVRVLAGAIEANDRELRVHSDDVARYVAAVAERLGVEPSRREELIFGSVLHDFGKIGISESIRTKPASLTPEERSAIELHPRIGSRLLEQVPALRPIAPWVLHHHERFDGGGYPGGLRGEDIPVEARVIGVADAFTAMIAERPYRGAMTVEEACQELERCAGTQFDPTIVRHFVEEVRKNPPADAPGPLLAAFEDPELESRRDDDLPLVGLRPFAATDSLTLLYSHRYFQDLVRTQAERAALQGSPFAVVVTELSDLDRINASDGYASGDRALRTAAQAVERVAAEYGGTACRYSGRRLAVVVPGANAGDADAVAAAVEQAIGSDVKVRVGAAAWQPGERDDDVVKRALYSVGPRVPAPVAP